MTFASFNLEQGLLDAVNQQNFARPFPIQREVIPAILAGRDLLAIAKTGSGKTAGFVLPLLQLVRRSPADAGRATKALILVPTRELAAQIGDVVQQLGRRLAPPIKTATVFGGVAINPQMIKLKGVELVIATPGRLLELVAKNSVKLSSVSTLVLDEADKLLDQGFQDELRQILALLPKKRQTLLFSATFGEEVRLLAVRLLANPLQVDMTEETPRPDLITQHIYAVEPTRKGPLLRYLIKTGKWQQVLIFVSSQRRAENVAKKLETNGITAATFHGGMRQGGRTSVLAAFKTGELQVLVATDLAARGIDIKFLPYVINYELPRSPNDYIHRIGRTGRAEASGVAVSLLCPEDLAHFKVIEKRLGERLPIIDTADLDLSAY
jgi:ATP-dependent RNA helicase RhlE